MRPAFTAWVRDAVAIDDLAFFVFEQREIEIAAESLVFELLDELLRILVAVDANREDLHFILFFFGEEAFQLAELLCAVGSPLAAVEH